LSAALGFVFSDKMEGSDAYTVVVVGDGAYTGGMIHEALNNCKKNLKLIIIMNENEMSISKNIGRFAENLSKIRTKSGYFKTKKITGKVLKKIPFIGNFLFLFVRGVKKAIKNVLYGSNYFENMGLTYLGPIDGNDYDEVENLLKEAKKLNESVVVHLKTQKGKGYEPAEAEPSKYHGMSPEGVGSDKKSFSEVMGEHLSSLADENKKICAITAAMSDGTGLTAFKEAHPDRFFDVGIAEEHALTFAAGLAANKMRHCAAIYSTFMQRAYDNIIHDVALQELPVLMLIDRAGINLKDGATHHGIFDVAFLSHIPNIRIYTPISNKGLRASIDEALTLDQPCAIRYPSGVEDEKAVEVFYNESNYSDISLKTDFDLSVVDELDVLIVTHGRIVSEALKVEENLKDIRIGIVLLEVLKPYDECAERIFPLLGEKLKAVLFYEEEIMSGGMGMNLADIMRYELADRNIKHDILAINDNFATVSKEGQNAYQMAGVDCKIAIDKIMKML
jgi:1-deoxy-D-xylulose-5-phosphate synthase